MLDDLKFCYERKYPTAPKPKHWTVTRAVAIRGKYWDRGYTLKIKFLNGDSNQINLMKSVIEEMTSPISLKVEYVEEGSDIRISFNYGYGSYSYLGTDARFISDDEETLNIGWSGASVMRHEFGHALNLSHEHQNPNGGIKWNEEKVIQDLSGPPNNWDERTIRHNVLNQYDLSQVDATKFDKDSVMLYYFPNDWTIGDFQTNDNDFLSSTDKQFLLDVYGESVDTIAPVITLNGNDQMVLEYGGSYIELGATALDNKDGDISDRIIEIGSVDTLESGIHPILYSVHDSAGNHTEKVRNVLVLEAEIVEPVEPEVVEPPYVDPTDKEVNSNKGLIIICAAIVLILIMGYILFK